MKLMNQTLKESSAARSVTGPFDSSETQSSMGYVDFGSILLPSTEQLRIRLDFEENSDRIVAISIDFHDSTLQLQAFAAPKSEGVWQVIREQLKQAVTSQGGSVTEQLGSFGPELLSEIPLTDQRMSQMRKARFIGVDGPRWFLRGVVTGAAIEDQATAVLLDEVFRKVIVKRGETPIPPRDLLPLKLPDGVVLPPR